MIEFDYDKIMQYKTVVNCKTLEQAINLLTWAHSKGLKWHDFDSYLIYNCWYEYKEDTCYNFYNGSFRCYDGCKSDNYKIYSYDEILMQKPLTKSDYTGNFNIRFMENLQ